MSDARWRSQAVQFHHHHRSSAPVQLASVLLQTLPQHSHDSKSSHVRVSALCCVFINLILFSVVSELAIYIHEGESPNTFNSLQETMHIGYALMGTDNLVPTTIWVNSNKLSLRGQMIYMDKLKDAVQNQIAHAYSCLTKVLRGIKITTLEKDRDIVDDHRNSQVGYNFLSAQENGYRDLQWEFGQKLVSDTIWGPIFGKVDD